MTEFREVTSAEDWDALVEERGGHPMQAWGWGELKERTGSWTARRIVIERDGCVDGACQVLVRKLPWPFGHICYAPRGPVASPDRLPEVADATPMYYTPDGGENYHTDQNCSAVRSTYLPLTEITYGDLKRYPFTELTPCGSCGAPSRPEVISAWNSVIDQAYEELGLTP